MKTLKTLGILLLMATSAMAQINPDNMFISGYVLDSNGQAQANQTVCVAYVSNSPVLPSDTICATTNSNGYYFVDVVNGSLSGPNVTYTISTYDPCAFLPIEQTRINGQGTIDTANVNFSICATGGCNLQVSLTSSYDSLNNIYTLDAGAGFASYSWSNGETTQTVQVQPSPNGDLVCVTVADASGCTAMDCDTLYGGGNPTPCGGYIQSSANPIGGTTLEVVATGGTPPYAYYWDNSGASTAQTISVTTPGVYCCVITDNNGCSFTTCDTVGNPNNCSVEITTTIDSSVTGLVYTLSASGGFSQYVWSSNQVGQSITVSNLNPNGEVYCVSATDANGCTATACDTLLPTNPNGCQAGFTYQADANGNLIVGDTVQLFFDGVSGINSTFDWTLSAGGFSFNATGANPVFAIPPTLLPVNGMNVEICVTVSDATCTDTYCQTILAVPGNNNNNCQADYDWYIDSSLGAPLPGVQFTDQSSGNAVYWFWDFGDGSTSTDQNPLHLYNGNGPFSVCLTVITANQQCQSTYCDSLYLGSNPGNCSALFTNSGPTPIGYTFSANVQNPNLDYYWTIDNQYVGNGYEAYAPGFTNGVHTVCLAVVDSLNNCFDQQCQTITIGNNNCYGYISGEVFAGSNNQPLDEGVVYLILHDPVNNTLTAVDSMVVDSGNYYFFGPLACGDYLIKAAAYSGSQYYSNHIPTYYGNSPFWGFAQTVSLGQVNAQVTADVTLIAANNPGGPGFIGGDVTQGANKTDPGDPLSGMQVMLYDLSGNAIAYAYTDANGAFGFSNLAYGTYQVYVEVLGAQTIPAVVTIGPEAPSEENVHILASETLISTGIEAFDFDAAIGEVYPNPVVDGASINFNLEAEITVTVLVLDLTGRAISAQTISVASGENLVRINSENLKDGYYFLNIQDVDGTFSVTRKFMRVD